jgi:hypothetical protein
MGRFKTSDFCCFLCTGCCTYVGTSLALLEGCHVIPDSILGKTCTHFRLVSLCNSCVTHKFVILLLKNLYGFIRTIHARARAHTHTLSHTGWTWWKYAVRCITSDPQHKKLKEEHLKTL